MMAKTKTSSSFWVRKVTGFDVVTMVSGGDLQPLYMYV